MRIYFFLILSSFFSSGCKLNPHRTHKSHQSIIDKNTSLKQLVNSLFISIQLNDTLGFEKLILPFDKALAEINKNVSLSYREQEIKDITEVYNYMKLRHGNLDTLFSKTERGFKKYGFKVVELDSVIYFDSTYKKANLLIRSYTEINSYIEMTIKDCIYSNGQWYLSPNIYIPTHDFLKWDVLYAMYKNSAKLNPKKDTFNYTKCDTFFVGIDAILIDSFTYIYKGDTLKRNNPLKNGTFVIECTTE